MSETTPTPPADEPTEKPARTARAKKPRLGGVVKLSDTGGYGVVVGDNLVCRLGPAESHALEIEPVE